MTQFVDRRLNGKNKSAVNRQRFLQRYKRQIKQAVTDAIAKRSITDIEQGETVVIPNKDISEPTFQHGEGGVRETIYPGNIDFIEGDTIPRPSQEAQEKGSEASQDGEGEDEFIFNISREEFLDIYFEDLELPDLIKKQIAQIPHHKFLRAGFTTSGVPTNINVVRSMRHATGRRMALAAPHRRKLLEAEAELEALLKTHSENDEVIKTLLTDIEFYRKRVAAVPFIDTIDLRYNNKIRVPQPTTQAVMFCLMDVSGSMDEVKKDIAKRFFILLYLFLTRNYQKIELVFIRHHTSAKEVDEEEFFYSRETGGTVVSSALELMRDIIQKRYPTNAWNIYAAQASDGDNWNADSPYCQELLRDAIMPFMQYFAYIEILPRHHQSLWEAYLDVHSKHPNFTMQNIDKQSDIYPVFRELFKRQMV